VIPLQPKWIHRGWEQALLVATWSKDPNRQVGCVLVDRNKRFHIGYNGPPNRVSDRWVHKQPRDHKNAFTIHAEVNAVLNARNTDLNGATAFVTRFPCCTCLTVMLQVGIGFLVAPGVDLDHPRWGDQWRMAKLLLSQAGVHHLAAQELCRE